MQYAEVAEKFCKEVKGQHFPDSKCGAAAKGLAFKSEEKNGVVRFIKSASSAFARGGSESAGVHGQFKAYVKDSLHEHGFNTIPLVPFRGNRFNILFFNAGFIFLLHQEMKSFLEKNGATNGLLKAVEADLNEPFYIASCKALGLISNS